MSRLILSRAEAADVCDVLDEELGVFKSDSSYWRTHGVKGMPGILLDIRPDLDVIGSKVQLEADLSLTVLRLSSDKERQAVTRAQARLDQLHPLIPDLVRLSRAAGN